MRFETALRVCGECLFISVCGLIGDSRPHKELLQLTMFVLETRSRRLHFVLREGVIGKRALVVVKVVQRFGVVQSVDDFLQARDGRFEEIAVGKVFEKFFPVHVGAGEVGLHLGVVIRFVHQQFVLLADAAVSAAFVGREVYQKGFKRGFERADGFIYLCGCFGRDMCVV